MCIYTQSMLYILFLCICIYIYIHYICYCIYIYSTLLWTKQDDHQESLWTDCERSFLRRFLYDYSGSWLLAHTPSHLFEGTSTSTKPVSVPSPFKRLMALIAGGLCCLSSGDRVVLLCPGMQKAGCFSCRISCPRLCSEMCWKESNI